MAWQDLAREQDGLVTRRQLMGSGLSSGQAHRGIRNRRWQPVGRGVYATTTGRLDEWARLRAALLQTGPESAAGHRTALWLAGVLLEAPSVITIVVPHHRRLTASAGVRLHRRRDFDELVHPAGDLRRVRLEAAVLDVADSCPRADPVLTLLFRATQGRFTTAGRLRQELTRRHRHRWRRLLLEVLDDVEDGAQSNLERRYRRDVELAHGLPRGTRNRTEHSEDGNRYRDVRYLRWRLVVELDGKQAHPQDARHLDDARDNRVVVDLAHLVLRYGWHAVAINPCEVARQVAVVLRRNGWNGAFRRCPNCATS